MKVSLIQTEWQEQPDQNIDVAKEMIAQTCRDDRPDVVCLPEFFMGPPWYLPGQLKMKGLTDTKIPGPRIEQFQQLARQFGIYLHLGSIVEQLPDGKYRNTSLLLNRQGEIEGQAYKIHLFANETVVCAAGETVDVIETEFGTIGIAVCSDFWVPETIRILAVKGAHTVFIPGGSLKSNLNSMVNALATTSYINCVNLVYSSPVGKVTGERAGKQITVEFAGTSLISTPKGILAKGSSDTRQTLVAEIDVQQTIKLRQPSNDDDSWKSLYLRSPGAYQGLLGEYVNLTRNLKAETRESFNQIKPA